MERKHIILLVGCSLGVSLILGALYALSPLNKKIYRSSFYRNFTPKPAITQKAVLDLGYNSYYISGATSNNIYLSNYTSPLHLVAANTMLTDSQHVRLKINGLDSIVAPGKLRTRIDSPYFYFTHGIMPMLFRGILGHWEASRFMPDSAYFVEAVPIGSSSFALRSHSLTSKAYELAKEISDPPYFEFKYGLLEKQIDGLFCVDGTLHYNKKLNQLVYLYSYRNQYIVTDTNLNLINRYHTIDTFSRARIKVANIESQNSSMLASPPTIINGLSSVSGNYLFIQSNLLAKNEDLEKFIGGVVIDVYDLTNGIYSHSFYLPDYKSNKLSDFKVFDNQLAALFEHYLIVYNLNSNN